MWRVKVNYVHLTCWPRSESWLLAQQASWTTTLPILQLEDSRLIFAVRHKGNSCHCLPTCWCLSLLSWDWSQSLQAYVSTGKQCIPSRRHWLLGALHLFPKTAWQNVCFLSELPCQYADGTFWVPCEELSHNQALVPATTSHLRFATSLCLRSGPAYGVVSIPCATRFLSVTGWTMRMQEVNSFS